VTELSAYDKYSGTYIIQFVIQLCKALNIKHIGLYDGSSVRCGKNKVSLAYYKFISNSEPFYVKNGFKPSLHNDDIFLNTDIKLKTLKLLLKNIHNVKTDLILKILQNALKLIVNASLANKQITMTLIDIFITAKTGVLKTYSDITLTNGTLFTILDKLLMYLQSYRKEKFTDTLINIYNKDCDGYAYIIDYFIDDPLHELTFNKKKVNFKILYEFRLLYELRVSYYTMDLK
jgi:hypothetical protein